VPEASNNTGLRRGDRSTGGLTLHIRFGAMPLVIAPYGPGLPPPAKLAGDIISEKPISVR